MRALTQEKTEGIVLKGLEQEKGLEQLLRDIANMQDKEGKLQGEVRSCKANVLDYYNRARKICAHNRGEDDGETAKMTRLVANLAAKFAEEESSRVGKNILEQEALGEESPGKKQAKAQVCVCVYCV